MAAVEATVSPTGAAVRICDAVARLMTGRDWRSGRTLLRPLGLLLLGAALLVAMIIVVLFLPMVEGEEAVDIGFFVFLFAGLWLYWALGAIVVLRADGHTVGWLFALAAPVTGVGLRLLRARLRPDGPGAAGPDGQLVQPHWHPAVQPRDHPAASRRRPRLPDRHPAGPTLARAGRRRRRSWSRADGCRRPEARADGRRRSRQPADAVAGLDAAGRRGPVRRSSTPSAACPSCSVRHWGWRHSSCVRAAPGGSSASSSSGCWSPWCPRRSCSRSACSRPSRQPCRRSAP